MAALSQAFRGAEGIPAPTGSPTGGGGSSFADLLAAVESGQMPAEMLIQLLSALTGGGPDGMQQAMGGMESALGGGGGMPGPGGEQDAIAAAMMGG